MHTDSMNCLNKQTTNSKYFIYLTLLLSTLFLSACGGGGGSAPNSGNNTSTLEYPSNVSVIEGDTQVTVSWDAVSGADTYSIYVNDNTYASDQSFIKNTSTSSLSVTITGLVNAQIHTLVVYASNATNATSTSYGSVSVQFTPLGPLPLPVTDFVVTPKNQAISVAWTATTYATRYDVVRSTSADFSTGVTTLNTGGTDYSFDNLVNGTTLYFKIRSENNSGVSDYSTVYSATANYQQGWNTIDYISTDAGGANIDSNTVTMNSTGSVIASWVYGAQIGSWAVAYVNIYNKATSSWGTPLQLSTTGGTGTEERQVESDLNDNGDGIAIWKERSYLDADNTSYREDMYVKHYQSGAWGADIKLNDVESGQYPSDPDIKLDLNGNALAVWHGDNGHFYARTYQQSTDTWSAVTQISTSISPYSVEAIVDVDTAGVLVVLWDEVHAASSMTQIFIRRFSDLGGWGATALINTDTPLSTTSNFDSTMAVSPNGDIYVSWVYRPALSDYRLTMRKYTASLDSWGTDITVDTSNNYIEWIKIKSDANSNAILSWNKRFNVDLDTIASLNVAVYKSANSAFGPIEEMLVTDLDVQSFDTIAIAGNTFSMFYNLAGSSSANKRVYDLTSETWGTSSIVYQYFASDAYALASNASGEIMLTGDLIVFDYSSLSTDQYIRATLFLP